MASTHAIVVGLTTVLWLLAGTAMACTPVIARKGFPLLLQCNICQPPPSEGTQWYNITGGAREDITTGIQPGNGDLLLADSVQDSAFGGQEYECQCELGSECYIIHVVPQVTLTISPQVAELGSSVSIVCTAESYPPANNTSDFHLFSPRDRRLHPTWSASEENGVEYHIPHVNWSHRGEYSCFVSIEEGVQSNTVEENLTVKPQVNLIISPPVAKLGSSVSIVCIAESYPPANDTFNFHLLSPHGQRLNSTQSAFEGYIEKYHIAHVNRSHGGGYSCSVSIEGHSDIQSNKMEKNLTVYDPPHIVSIHNFTLCSEPQGVESAVLECGVENMEANLKVWVDWTAGADSVVRWRSCVSETRGHFNMFALILHNVTENDFHLYTCHLFSAFSPNKTEDQGTAEILIAGADPLPKKEKWHFGTGALVSIIAAAVVVGAVGMCIIRIAVIRI